MGAFLPQIIHPPPPNSQQNRHIVSPCILEVVVLSGSHRFPNFDDADVLLWTAFSIRLPPHLSFRTFTMMYRTLFLFFAVLAVAVRGEDDPCLAEEYAEANCARRTLGAA